MRKPRLRFEDAVATACAVVVVAVVVVIVVDSSALLRSAQAVHRQCALLSTTITVHMQCTRIACAVLHTQSTHACLRDGRVVRRAHVHELERPHTQRRALGGAGALELRDELLEGEVE